MTELKICNKCGMEADCLEHPNPAVCGWYCNKCLSATEPSIYKEFVCPKCGKICMTEYALLMHQNGRRCGGKNPR